jgi:hypothetical protein
MDYTNKALGLRVQTQIPLNVKEYKENEESLKNLGVNNNLAFIYEKGLVVYCIEEGSRWEWKEVISGEENTGLLDSDFIYPDNIITFNIDYSNKVYNFFSIEPTLPPLEKITESSKTSIVIRGRDPLNYGPIGDNAVDLSISTTPSNTLGARGTSSFTSGDSTTASGSYSTATGADTIASNTFANAEGYQSIASGYASHAEGEDTEASGTQSHSEGFNTLASGDTSHAQNLNTLASGISSHAEGEQTTASGDISHVEGFQSRAIAKYSHAGGNNNDANAYCETSIGMFGTAPSGNPTTYVSTDRLFSLGNGTNGGSLSDAFTILKNGLAELPSVTNALITAASGKVIVTKEYLTSITPDGSETKINNGTNTIVTGNGTTATPFQIAVPTPTGAETIVTAGTGVTITGTGTTPNPYIVNANAGIQVLIQYLPIWQFDYQHSLAPALSGSTIISAIPYLECTTANNGFIIGDIVTVNTPEGDGGIGVQYNNSTPTVMHVLVGDTVTIMEAYTAVGDIANPITPIPADFKIRVVIFYI